MLEVLDGRPYTFASDVYNFGIIMVEMSTGKPPYGSVPHDEKLALAICNGLRPRVAKGTPQCYIWFGKSMSWCKSRKKTFCYKLIKSWRYDKNGHAKLFEEFIDADKNISQETPSETTTNPEAVYTSRFMSFTNLSKPINSTGIQIEDPEGINIIISIVFILYSFIFIN